MTTQYFHFSLAPVQAFIAQARRTRDFWTGSFILSWLSAVAMKAVTAQNGKIIFPEPDEDYLLWLEGEGTKDNPEHGGVPNRFKAEVSSDFKPEIIVASVQAAWKALADKVFEGDFMTASPSKDWQSSVTKQIWDKQVETFWDMTWVLTEDPENSAALDVRKNWRSYLPPEQVGVKCMMMEGWQELSGAVKPSEEVRTFWQTVRNNTKAKGMKTDLREKEHLCAIAFIKRRFPRYFNENLVVKMPNNWMLKGWEVKAGRPSVAYMAAVRWLEQVLKIAEDTENPENAAKVSYQLRVFRYKAYRLTKSQYNEWDNQITCLKPFAKHKKWLSLDGNVFFESALENKNIYPDQEQKKQVNQKQPAENVLDELKALQKLLPDNIKRASPFYAVLMMDGDKLGEQMSKPKKQTTISEGLNTFTKRVSGLVQQHNGFLIYAGGDDVLAVLPLEDALDCALAIRQKYECVFAEENQKVIKEKQVVTSISAAVLFAHINMPLKNVLKEAHQLLDNVAKDQYGRDSLAVSVWKPGGKVLEWARPWDKAIEKNEQGDKRLILKRLADDFAKDDPNRQFSNRFLYKIRERFELLNPPKKLAHHVGTDCQDSTQQDEKKMPILNIKQARDLMAAEYVSSGLCESKGSAVKKMWHARRMVRPLLQQCRPIYRQLDEKNTVSFKSDSDVLVDAALLIRFLAQHGVNL